MYKTIILPLLLVSSLAFGGGFSDGVYPVTSSGNIAIGGADGLSWSSNILALSLGINGAVWVDNSTKNVVIGSNTYVTPAGYVYASNGSASYMSLSPTGTVTFASWGAGIAGQPLSGYSFSSASASGLYSGGNVSAGTYIISGLKLYVDELEPGAPTISVCGTSPTVTGSDQAGMITTGSGTVTSCTLTFAVPWSVFSVKSCTLTPGTLSAPEPYLTALSNSAFTIQTSASAPSTKYYYSCF